MALDLRTRLLRRYAYLRFASWLDRGDVPIIRLGSAGCGWNVPSALVRPGATALCVGAGEDISFDIALASAGVATHCLDPTPRARAHVSAVLDGGNATPVGGPRYDLSAFDRSTFNFWPYGLWNRTETQRFYAPRDSRHVSHSIVNLQGTDDFFEAECLRLADFLDRADLQSVDILKLDVEGAEYAILDDVLAGHVLPTAMLIEYDEANHPKDLGFLSRIKGSVDRARAKGYRLVHVEACNFTLLRDDYSAVSR